MRKLGLLLALLGLAPVARAQLVVRMDYLENAALRRYFTARPDSLACLFGALRHDTLTLDSVEVTGRCYPTAVGAFAYGRVADDSATHATLTAQLCAVLREHPPFQIVGVIIGIDTDTAGHRAPHIVACWLEPAPAEEKP